MLPPPPPKRVHRLDLAKSLKKVGWVLIKEDANVSVFTNGWKAIRVSKGVNFTTVSTAALLLEAKRINKELEWKIQKYPFLFTEHLKKESIFIEAFSETQSFWVCILLIVAILFMLAGGPT